MTYKYFLIYNQQIEESVRRSTSYTTADFYIVYKVERWNL